MMLRKTLTIISLTGLLLSVALWVVSRTQYATYQGTCGKLGIGNGCLILGWYGECLDSPPGWYIEEDYSRYGWIQRTQFGGGGSCFWIPLWMPALLSTSVLTVGFGPDSPNGPEPAAHESEQIGAKRV